MGIPILNGQISLFSYKNKVINDLTGLFMALQYKNVHQIY
ncbi:uncharacterized protein METZ01_LOCUS292394 [marine metagenome]|uniref:Uncharacterized protein n=1 Tax=marine metagenome TaxID=408172 RepID=A0A382LSF8_9ZZZZ